MGAILAFLAEPLIHDERRKRTMRLPQWIGGRPTPLGSGMGGKRTLAHEMPARKISGFESSKLPGARRPARPSVICRHNKRSRRQHSKWLLVTVSANDLQIYE